MTAHFAGVAFALLIAGAAILIVAGLAHEGSHGKGRHLHLFPDLAEPGKRPVAAAPVPKAVPENSSARADSDVRRARADRKEKPKKQRRREEKRRERRRARRGVPAPEAETGDAGSGQSRGG